MNMHSRNNQNQYAGASFWPSLGVAIAMLLIWQAPVLAEAAEVVASSSTDASNHDHAHHAHSVAGSEQAKAAVQEPAESETIKHDHEGMDHGQMEGMDHSEMEGMDHSQMEGMDHSKMEGIDHNQMEGMDHGNMDMQGGSAPPDARNPDYSDGLTMSHMPGMHHMHGNSVLGSVRVDHLEQFNGQGGSGQAINAQAWVGSDLQKFWFKLEGEREDGHLGATRMELLWDKALSAYWDFQAGVRHDTGDGPSRNWAAIGVQGLAPYWFEMEATAYVGEQGRTALRLESEYELLLTQRWVLQPDVELNIYGKDDPARGIGAGLSDLELGLRLRYEITRKFAPYVGVVWTRKFGKTADYAEEESEQVNDTQLVAGLRFWF